MPPAPGAFALQDFHDVAREPQDVGGINNNAIKDLNNELFKDKLWTTAKSHFKSKGLCKELGEVREVLRRGAASFGFWELSDSTLEALVQRVKEQQPDAVSPGLQSWLAFEKKQRKANGTARAAARGEAGRRPQALPTGSSEEGSDTGRGGHAWPRLRQDSVEAQSDEWQSFGSSMSLRRFKWGIALSVLLCSALYAVFVVNYQYSRPGPMQWVPTRSLHRDIFATTVETSPDGSHIDSSMSVDLSDDPYVVQALGPLVYVARGAAMAAILLTSILYFTMARSWNKWLYLVLPKMGFTLNMFDGLKELHVFTGKLMLLAAGLHIGAHAFGSVPGLKLWTVIDLDLVNSFIGCANRRDKFDFGIVNLAAASELFAQLTWDACPMTDNVRSRDVYFGSMTGLSGFALTALIVLMGYTGRRVGRATNFDRFYYVHLVGIYAWPVLLVGHGACGKLGIGVPLILLSTFPILLWLVDVFRRIFQFNAQIPCGFCRSRKAGQGRIKQAVIRPGRDGGSKGAMSYIQVATPPSWKFRPGMYAFICMPAYAPLQWHPFTICSGHDDDTVDFIVAGLGDWTEHLARCCLSAITNPQKRSMPAIALNGPFLAPAQSALMKKVLVTVGAGVGITPFLSVLSTILSLLSNDDRAKDLPLKEAHFYWLTRSADEFLFALRLFEKVYRHRGAREKIFLHLHCTQVEPPARDGPAFIFREAVRRQSEVDRGAFKRLEVEFEAVRMDVGRVAGPGLPWCWANRSGLDALWVSGLTGWGADDVGDASCPPPPTMTLNNQGQDLESAGDASPGAGDASPPQRSGWTNQLRDLALQSRTRRGRTETWPLLGSLTKGTDKAEDAEERAAEVSASQGPGSLLPVFFGRPDWETELRDIGMMWECDDINVYICGAPAIVKSVREVCTKLNRERRSHHCDKEFRVSFERFG